MGKALAAWLMVAGVVAATPTTPRTVVESAVTRVVSMLQEPNAKGGEPEPGGRLNTERRRAEMRRIGADLFDFDEVARLALSRNWAARTPEERAEFVRLFTQLLERTYLAKIESYSGEKIVYLADSVDGIYATVRSKVISGARHTETPLDYRLYLKDGQWRVFDVRIDGVSFVSTYRSEFNRIIQSSSYEALVEMLRKRVDDAAAADAARGGSASPRTTR